MNSTTISPVSRRTFLAGSVLGLGVTLAGCLSILESSSERSNDDDTKTYTNREYGFEITYPEAWEVNPDKTDIKAGELEVWVPTPTWVLYLQVNADESHSAYTWEDVSEFELHDHQTDISGYTVFAQRDVMLDGDLPARIVDARFPRSTDPTITIRQKMMNLVSPDGSTKYWISLIGRDELYELHDLDEIVEIVFASFKVL